MKTCYVCGTAMSSQPSQCRNCGTPAGFFEEVQNRFGRARFLFGQADAAPVTETPIATEASPPKKSAQRTTPRKATPPKASEPPAPKPRRQAQQMERAADVGDLIHNRDVVVQRLPPESGSLLEGRMPAHILDVALCLLLNLVVFRLILWLSPRDFSEMVTFSMIPLLFVLLCFTCLYFWLFLWLFQKTLGTMVYTLIRDRFWGADI